MESLEIQALFFAVNFINPTCLNTNRCDKDIRFLTHNETYYDQLQTE